MKKTVIFLPAALLMLPLCESLHAQRRSDYKTFDSQTLYYSSFVIHDKVYEDVAAIDYYTDIGDNPYAPMTVSIYPANHPERNLVGNPNGTLFFAPVYTLSLFNVMTFTHHFGWNCSETQREQLREPLRPDIWKYRTIYTRYYNGTLGTYIYVRDFRDIVEYAFRDINSLEQAEIGPNVGFLGKGVFQDCKNLKYVKFGPQVRVIDQDCFLGCSSLEVVEFEKNYNVQLVNDMSYMFHTDFMRTGLYCTKMKAFVVPDGEVDLWRDMVLWDVFRPVSQGTCRVISRSEFYSPRVNGVTLDTSLIVLPADSTYQLTATVSPSDTYNKKVIWSSDKPSVATVSATGLVTYVSPGTATITAMSEEDGRHMASAAVTTYLPVNYATLKALTVTGYALSPAFNENTFAYTVTVPFSVRTVSLVAVANHKQVSVTGAGEQLLDVGDNVISVVANSGFSWYDNKTYTVTVHRKSTDATLWFLSAGGNTLPLNNPARSVTVSNAVTSVEVVAKTTHPLASVSVSGANSLNAGDNIVTVTVTAEDGNTETYTIQVHRKSADATVRSLSAGGTVFSPDNPARSITVPNAVTSVVVTAETTHPLASVSVGGAKPLNVGDNTVTVTVTAEDGNTETYTITVHRKSLDATLKAITLDGQSVSSSFAPSHLNYQITVENAVSGITLEAVTNYYLASATGTGNKTLRDGYNSFAIMVTPEEGLPKTYTVTVYRKSADDRLQSLTLSNTLNGSNISMEYNPEKLTYTATVPVSVKNISLNARANHSAAIVTGHTGIQSLRPGRNIFHITVTSEDGTVKTYPVVVTVVGNVII